MIDNNFNEARMVRLCRQAVASMALDLKNIRVLTEAATGPFAATAAIAAFAGAEVIAVSQDSRWGKAEDAFRATAAMATRLNCLGSIKFVTAPASTVATGCELVTNLRFVRPISATLAAGLAPCAAIALMWEPWEFRDSDIDKKAVEALGIPIVATNEGHPFVKTYSYLGPTVGRLLLNLGIELVGSRILLVGSDPFGGAVAEWLKNAGVKVKRALVSDWVKSLETFPQSDALVLVEHRKSTDLLDASGSREALVQLAATGAPIVRLCGKINRDLARSSGCWVVPDMDVPHGFMTVTTAHVGPRPVIDLHTAGLKAAATAVLARRAGKNLKSAVEAAVSSGFGLALEAAS